MKIDQKRLTFVYEDSGNGFEKDVSFKNSKNLGLTLIQLQFQQLESEYSVQLNGKFRLSFNFLANEVDSDVHSDMLK
jgi:two-component sensor histidine kinase